MTYVLTILGKALRQHRSALRKVMGDQSRETGRPVLEISAIERGALPLPSSYIGEFVDWAQLSPEEEMRLRSLPCAAVQSDLKARANPERKAPAFIKDVSARQIASLAMRVRQLAKLGRTFQFSLLQVIELDLDALFPGLELHVESASSMGDREAYVAEFPLRIVVSDATYERAHSNQGRERFTLAHEIGHLMLHREYLFDPDAMAARTSETLSTISRCERQANQFAAEFLLPESAVRSSSADPELIRQQFGVTKAAAENRLRSLRLWPPKNQRIIDGFAKLQDELRANRDASVRASRSRHEQWGRIDYDLEADEFTAIVHSSSVPLLPRAPIGIGWVILGGCNERCIHCYGNQEELPAGRLAIDDAFKVVEAIRDAGVMRVVISGGEPLMFLGIFDVVDRLLAAGISVVLGTNGTYLSRDNVRRARGCARVEISLDAADQALNNQIRISRKAGGDAWGEAIGAMRLCLDAAVPIRALTAINSLNQHSLLELGRLLNDIGVQEWALSWTVPAGRAAPIYPQLRPDSAVIEDAISRIREELPNMRVRYSNRQPEQFNRFYFLILPDGQIATEDFVAGEKVRLGSALEVPLMSTWTSSNFDRKAHFAKWIAKTTRLAP